MKKLISKILNWSGFQYTWDAGTNNTTDTWVPVFKNGVIQHRVIPSNADVTLTKYGSAWTGGIVTLRRRGNLVFVSGYVTLTALSARTRIGTIPSGFIPPGVAYIFFNGTTRYMLWNTDGSVQVEGGAAGSFWFSGCYAVN